MSADDASIRPVGGGAAGEDTSPVPVTPMDSQGRGQPAGDQHQYQRAHQRHTSPFPADYHSATHVDRLVAAATAPSQPR